MTGNAAPAEAVPVSSRGPLDEESSEWLRCLSGTGRDARGNAEREQALARLHQMLLRVARAELLRRSRPVGVDGRELDDLAHQAADDALVAITSKLNRFRGDSRFTTWAYKFVILEVSAKLGRHYLRNAPVQAADDAWDRIPDRFGADPAQHAETRELAQALRRAVTESLSERQRRVFVAIVVEGIPLDALALDVTIVNIALPSAQQALHFSADGRQWIITAYALTFGSLLLLVSREPQSAELWHWLLKPGSRYGARPDPDGTDVLIMVTRGALAMTVDGQTNRLAAGTAGHIVSGTGYLLANPGRAEAAFALVHIPPAGTRARYTRALAHPSDTS